jgi:hypothetical protein
MRVTYKATTNAQGRFVILRTLRIAGKVTRQQVTAPQGTQRGLIAELTEDLRDGWIQWDEARTVLEAQR